ncbi:methyltransferase domain-containing protein [Herbaspirillum sp. RTI4]|uniref:methyltransferase domain-containing protein n=1 Tax=Herbaspirillum sp. RTI4 TaxID=3048640 RepID=UPI002AB4EB20|nr:methyltransferase domain-containing protein [Herbaspirillum sp. RTI4]MDY7577690.1 methyltransferase domain-containing protein [Herbaspirillum sp. RTI4]MEA9983465.1 methyltransferase domain-containing protein [Herbaspirillum sp. RTI4]
MSVIPPFSDVKLSAPIDLSLVRQLFSNTERVAGSDFLRREIASRMQERLALINIEPQQVLDAGCGEGADLLVLQQRFPAAQVIGLDGASAMLAVALERRRQAWSSLHRWLSAWLPAGRRADQASGQLLCGDFAQLPFGTNALDLVWSNLALHWHPQPDRLFAEWRRVLRVGGVVMFSCFGPDTFREIRQAFEAVDDAPHVLPFVDMHDFGDMLVTAGFSTPVMDMEMITVTYDSAQQLLRDARAWGGNPLETRQRGLLGRAAKERLIQALESQRRPDGKLGLSFEVVYGHAFRPEAKKIASGESIIRFDSPKK